MKLISTFAMTLDGKITIHEKDKIGSSWDFEQYLITLSTADAVLVGRKTFEKHNKPRIDDNGNRKPVYCITTDKDWLPPCKYPPENIFYSLEEALKFLEQQGHKTILLEGAGLTNSALWAGRLDYLYMTIVAELFNQGIPFCQFSSDAKEHGIDLELKSWKGNLTTNEILLEYKVVKKVASFLKKQEV